MAQLPVAGATLKAFFFLRISFLGLSGSVVQVSEIRSVRQKMPVFCPENERGAGQVSRKTKYFPSGPKKGELRAQIEFTRNSKTDIPLDRDQFLADLVCQGLSQACQEIKNSRYFYFGLVLQENQGASLYAA